jgi:hypothetical protein
VGTAILKTRIMRGTMDSQCPPRCSRMAAGLHLTSGEFFLADDKLYKAEYLGSGTFVISKPKRKKIKMRQSQLKNPQRGARK